MTESAPCRVPAGRNLDAFLRVMDGRLAGRDDPRGHLRRVLAHDELALYCQPIAALESKSGYPMAEVLVRLHEEEKAYLPPGEFLPLFEHHGMLPQLDRWVIRNALRHLARKSQVPRLAINVSGQSLRDPAFPLAVAEELLAAHLAGSVLVFEIDEPALLAGGEALKRFAAAVRKLGCGITIDGFGRRSVTFEPLKGAWVDYVKVEGAIVRKLLTSEIAELRLKAVVHVGAAMGFEVIAEMVEDAELVIKLMSLGVPLAQGFGISRPQPIADFEAP